MQHINQNLKSIRGRIMRRVWYRFALSLLLSKAAAAGVLFGFSITLFFQLVSVPNIVKNLLSVELGNVPQYIWQTLVGTFVDGEFLKLATLALFVYFLFYLRNMLRSMLRNGHLSGEIVRSV
jgi:hypothetical protein